MLFVLLAALWGTSCLVASQQCIDPAKAIGNCCLTSEGTTSCGSLVPSIALSAEEVAQRKLVTSPVRRVYPAHLARYFSLMKEHSRILAELAERRGIKSGCTGTAVSKVDGTVYKPYNLGFSLQANDGKPDALQLTLTPTDYDPIDLKDQSLSETTSISEAFVSRHDFTLLTGECLSYTLFGGNVTTDSTFTELYRVEPVMRSTSIAGNGPRSLTTFYPTDCVTPSGAPFQLCAKQGTQGREAIFAILGSEGNILLLVPLHYPDHVSIGPYTPRFFSNNPFTKWAAMFTFTLFINPSTNQLNAGAVDVGWSHDQGDIPVIIKKMTISTLD